MLSSFLLILEHSPKSLQDPMSEAIHLRLQPVEAPVAAAHCSSPPPPTSLRSVFQSQSLYSQRFCTCCHSSWKLLRIPSLLPANSYLSFRSGARKALPITQYFSCLCTRHSTGIADCLSVPPLVRKTMCPPCSSRALLSTNPHIAGAQYKKDGI